MRRFGAVAGVFIVLAAAAPRSTLAQVAGYESYFRFLGDNPDAAEPDWANNAQGLAHDDSHWFITNNQGEIWKIPVTSDLCCTQAADPGVSVVHISDIPPLSGWEECKDPVCHQHAGTWYLFVPIAGGGMDAAVAVFRADSLAYLTHKRFVDIPGAYDPPSVLPSWCAINPAGDLFLPYNFGSTSGVVRYSISWIGLTQNPPQLIAQYEQTIELYSENGQPLFFMDPQGGEFSISGQYLYEVTGNFDGDQTFEGIHCFDTTTWHRIARSANGSGLFNFAYEPDVYEEPQGLTIWDLDGVPAAGIFGQMHVLLLDNDVDSDDVYLKHYTHRIWVNAASPSGDGTIGSPMHTVGQATLFAQQNNWNGCEIRIQTGGYPETMTISVRTRLVAQGGVAQIGAP